MFFKNKYLLVPVDLCKYALVNKKVNEVKIYIFLKVISSGKMQIPYELIESFSKELEMNPKTFKKHLGLLIQANWIGYNPKSGYYFIRGFEMIRKTEKFKTRSSCEFGIDDLKRFKAFCISAYVASCINQQRSKRWKSERLEARSNQDCQHDLPNYDTMVLEVLAGFLGISKTSAHLYMKMAKNAGYLTMQEKYSIINLEFHQVKQARKFDSRIKIINRKVVLQLPNKVTHYMHFKRRKKIEPYCKHNNLLCEARSS